MNPIDNKYQQLINGLTEDMEKKPQNYLSLTSFMLAWFICCLGLSATLMYLFQPFREDFISQIFQYSLFTLETLSGFIAIMLLATSVYFSSIPGVKNYFRWFAFVLTIAWIGIIFSGLFEPVLPASMVGKRELCFIEVVLYGLPITAFMTFLVYRRYSLTPLTSAILISFSSMLVPAYLMQYACMYEAQHNLLLHILPAIIASLILTPLVTMILHRRLKSSRQL